MDINFNKYSDGLVPAVIQDNRTGVVLMLGFMNAESYEQTKSSGRVTFFSRSKNRLWVKGETSGNFLTVADILMDCDQDTILIKAIPEGPVCHTGADTCFNEKNESGDFLNVLESVIENRKNEPNGTSYVSSLFAKGMNKIAQKVGEEAVEVVIEAKDNDHQKFLDESADLLFHYLILLKAKGFKLNDVKDVLRARHDKK